MNEDQHIGEVASALVLLAAIATTFSTYSYYKDDEVATQYEADETSLNETASALMSLRLHEQAALLETQASTTDTASNQAPN